jgi:hypothetical protein
VDPETLEDLIKLCVKIDQRLYDKRLERSSNKMSYGHSDKPKKPLPQGNQLSSTPMNLDYMDGQKTKSHGKLTKEERERRIQNNLCLYCGEPGHKVNSCSKRLERSLNTIELFSTLAPKEASFSLKVTLEKQRDRKPLEALLDSGANANFISQAAIEGLQVKLTKLDTPIAVRFADGSSKIVDSQVKNVKFKIQESSSGPLIFKADLIVIKDLRIDVVLGTPWFTSVNPKIDWKSRTIKFDRGSWSSSISLNSISLGDFKEKECSSNSLDTHLIFSETRMEEKEELEHKKSMETFEQYYSDFSSLFEEKELASLPPNRVCDMEVNLVDESSD